MSSTPSIPPIPNVSLSRERNCRKINASFRDGILEEYGTVKFSEIKDQNPMLYAHSRRPKAILQAKALRRLDKTLGLGQQELENKSALNLKERRKRANRLTYENGVIGNRAVQECIRDLYIGYDIRRVSQQLMLTRLQEANCRLEQLVELERKISCGNSFPNKTLGCMQLHPTSVNGSNQAFFQQDQPMMQRDVYQGMRAAVGYPSTSGDLGNERTFPSQGLLTPSARANPTYGIGHQSIQSTLIPSQYQTVLMPTNELVQNQKGPSSGEPQTEGLQAGEQIHHYELTQRKMPSMNNHQNVTPGLQPYHQSPFHCASRQGGIASLNQASQHVFPHAQPTSVHEKDCGIQNYHRETHYCCSERQNELCHTISHGLYPPSHYSLDQEMSMAQNVNGNGFMFPGNAVLHQQNQHETFPPQWNATVPVAYSEAISPNFHLGR